MKINKEKEVKKKMPKSNKNNSNKELGKKERQKLEKLLSLDFKEIDITFSFIYQY